MSYDQEKTPQGFISNNNSSSSNEILISNSLKALGLFLISSIERLQWNAHIDTYDQHATLGFDSYFATRSQVHTYGCSY